MPIVLPRTATPQPKSSCYHEAEMHIPLDPRVQLQLDRIENLLIRLTKMANALDAEIASLQAEVTAETTVESSAVTLINGISAQIASAVAAAQAAGASPAELAAITAVQASITASSTTLASAVAANTPAAPTT